MERLLLSCDFHFLCGNLLQRSGQDTIFPCSKFWSRDFAKLERGRMRIGIVLRKWKQDGKKVPSYPVPPCITGSSRSSMKTYNVYRIDPYSFLYLRSCNTVRSPTAKPLQSRHDFVISLWSRSKRRRGNFVNRNHKWQDPGVLHHFQHRKPNYDRVTTATLMACSGLALFPTNQRGIRSGYSPLADKTFWQTYHRTHIIPEYGFRLDVSVT